MTIITLAFQCVEMLCADFLPTLPKEHLPKALDVVALFAQQARRGAGGGRSGGGGFVQTVNQGTGGRGGGVEQQMRQGTGGRGGGEFRSC